MALAIGFNNRIDIGLVDAGSREPTLPTSNLQSRHVAKPWRSLAGTSTFLRCDFGASYSIAGTAIMAINTTSAATYRVRLSTVDATGVAGNAYDSGTISSYVISPVKKIFVHLFTAASGRYLRIDITDTSLSYLQAGRWFAGTVWQPGKTQAMDWEWLWDETTRADMSDAGQEWVERGVSRRGITFSLPYIGYAEMLANWESLASIAGQREDVLVVADTGDVPEASLWGRVQTPYGISHPAPAFRRTSSITVMERL